MIHPHTELRRIDPVLGYGVFATALIPKGTIVFAKDPFDIEVTPEQFETMDDILKIQTERYSYIDERGVRIVSWDMAKYVNHRCNCNTLSTGYGFEIALRDIHPSEEITDDYGLFNIPEPMTVTCACPNCRGQVRSDDIDSYHMVWDKQIQEALECLPGVSQPLWTLIDQDTQNLVMGYLEHRLAYKSVHTLKATGFGPHIIELKEVLEHPTQLFNEQTHRSTHQEH